MEKIVIRGGKKLVGEVSISGAKNAAVAIIPACLLINANCRLENLPDIKDVILYLEILQNLGAEIKYINTHTVDIDCTNVKSVEPDSTLTEKKAREEAIKSYESNVVTTVSGSDSPFDDKMNTWLFSDDTKVGSKKYYIDESAGYIYIVLKTSKASVEEDETYTVRHILVAPESGSNSSSSTSEKTEYTDEQWAAAKKKANNILAKFNKTDKSEYEFAKLAEQYSTDSASTSSGSNDSFGGLYESVTLGQMVPDFEKWSIDDSRKYGDTGIVKSDYGYHIMFFINDCPEYQSKIIAQIKSDRLSNMIDKAEIKVHENAIKKAVDKEKAAKEAAAESTTVSSPNSAQATTSASSGNN